MPVKKSRKNILCITKLRLRNGVSYLHWNNMPEFCSTWSHKIRKNNKVHILTGVQAAAVFTPSFVVVSLQCGPRVRDFRNKFPGRRRCLRRRNARSSLHRFYTVRLKLPHHDLNWTSTKHWRRQASLSFRKSTSRRGQHLSQHHTDISVGVLPGPFYPTTLVV